MEQLKRLLAMLSTSQRWTILVATVLISAGFYSLVHWEKESAFRPLYTTLAPEDAAVVIQKLKEGSTEYRLSNNGTTVSVPEDKVAELRLELAAAGVPKSGRIGFEIFDKTNFGMTDFAEHINYRRAVEGELERSVMAIAEVEQARVHITFPKESVFSEAQQPAKASVLIKIRPGASLPETAIPAITHLISSAVEGLAPESVSVLDMRGNLLNRAKRVDSSGAGDSSEAALEYRHKVEQDLTSKLEATLEPLVGAGRFRASVVADTDLSSGEQSEESFDPTKSAMVSSQTTEDTSTPTRAIAGIPGTASNLPDAAPKPAVTGGGTSRKTENVNYQTSRTVKRTVLPQGSIKRLSVSVLIDHEAHWEGTGANAKRVLVPPSPERMKVIHDLVAATAGFNMDRGDTLFVEALPFESTLNLDPPLTALPPAGAAPKQKSPLEELKANPKLLAISGAVVVVLLAGCGFLVMRMRKSSASAAKVQVTQALPEASAAGNTQELSRAATAAQDTWAPSMQASGKVPTLAPARLETLTTQLRETAQKDAEICAGVLRGWLKEGQV
ncbi:MAG TPA: flagellar basal-body MS-ring/collar protein FliF [Bryobacteraceae bacterium]|nr:flagellar basal-body MS-ring/collar protein FliF [Bryobacteraceae bacterium]